MTSPSPLLFSLYFYLFFYCCFLVSGCCFCVCVCFIVLFDFFFFHLTHRSPFLSCPWRGTIYQIELRCCRRQKAVAEISHPTEHDPPLCCIFCVYLMLTDANTPKKCRALFGLDRQTLWCKPCRYITTARSLGKIKSLCLSGTLV